MSNWINGILDKISIKNKINLLIIFIALTIFTTSTVINFYNTTNITLNARLGEVSALTEVSLNLVKEYKQRMEKGEFSEAEAKSRAITRINSLKFDSKNYIWINDYNYIFLAHPKLQGTDGSNLKDKNGLEIIVEGTKIAKEKGNGSFKYYWSKPGANPNSKFEKITYVRSFPEWGWVIGAGIYIDDVLKQVQTSLIINGVINLILVFIVVIIANLTIRKSITDPIDSFSEISQKLANNDLTVQIPEDNNKTEIGNLNRSFKLFLNNLKSLIGQISELSSDVSASSQEMHSASEQTAQGAQQTAISTTQLAQGAQEVSRNVEDGAANINKMNKVIQEISQEAYIVSKLGNETETNANVGAEHVKKAVNKIDSIKQVSGDISVNIAELGDLSAQIEEIVDLIKSIAGQTNLLALNAAIEAARAGEHGKGFAVVADEVKKLAGQSSDATEKITGMIKEIQNKTSVAVSTMDKATHEVEEGVLVINDAGKALENIISQVKTANIKIQSITKDIDGVARNSEEMVQMIENISAITEETAASAEEISSISEEQTASLEEISASSQALSGISDSLNKQVSVFRI
ncbi:MAG: hypothetical protein A2039_03800 [Candidatus Melainabacteria bacterium GWA2_34_9]|nr:MAG: hypothetical protein A2039_03800 [Candidatus Melainabacteria bacterium GWA2_34_9]